MRKISVFLIMMLVTAGFAFSQVKIGVINAQEIIQKTKKGLAIQKKLENFQSKKQQELQAMQNAIKKLEKDLLSPALNEDTREKKSAEMQSKRKDLKRFVEDAQADFQRRSQKELVELEKEIMPLITSMGKAKGFTIIFDITRPGVVYYDEAIDITADVIKAIDAKTN